MLADPVTTAAACFALVLTPIARDGSRGGPSQILSGYDLETARAAKKQADNGNRDAVEEADHAAYLASPQYKIDMERERALKAATSKCSNGICTSSLASIISSIGSGGYYPLTKAQVIAAPPRDCDRGAR